jgi:hypothetical protein
MKRGSGYRAGRVTILAAIALALTLAGCASTAPRQPVEPEPAVCVEPSLAALRAEHPDSLSEREWRRLQTLERYCDLARTEVRRDNWNHTGVTHPGWWVGSGVVMALMMITMWSPW